MRDIARSIRDTRSYFTDDTLRTISLSARATSDVGPEPEIEAVAKKATPDRPRYFVPKGRLKSR